MANGRVRSTSRKRSVKEPLFATSMIVFLSVAVAVGGIVYKTKEHLQRDKLEFLSDANAKQVAPLRRVVQLRLAQAKARLVQFASTRSIAGPGRARVFGEYALVSLMTPVQGGQWGVSWIEKGPLFSQLQSSNVMVLPNQEIALLKSLPYDRIRDGEVYWQRLSDDKGRPLWALAVSVETQTASKATQDANALPENVDYRSVRVGTGGKAVVVGFFGRNPLLSSTEDFIGSTSTAFVIDSRGYTATHSNKTMVGALLRDDPSVKEIFTARSSAGATQFKNSQGTRVYSAFEQVDRSNLYVVMSTPELTAGIGGESFGRTALTTGGIAVVFGLLLVFAWGAYILPRVSSGGRDSEIQLEEIDSVSAMASAMINGGHRRPNAARMGAPAGEEVQPLELPQDLQYLGQRPVLSPLANPNLGLASIQERAHLEDQGKFLRNFIAGLEGSMKEPLLAAMAHLQLAKSKSSEEKNGVGSEIADHVVAIERDLRRAKATIDELGEFAQETVVPNESERVDLLAAVTACADTVRADLEKEGITLEIQAKAVPQVYGTLEFAKRVIAEGLANAKQSLIGRNGKVIKIRLEEAGASVLLMIVDNGVGMDRETRAQAFEPFFRRFDTPQAKGIGLARVKNIVAMLRGTCELASAPGDGTSLILRWPVLPADLQAFSKSKRGHDTTDTASTSPNFSEEGAISLGGKVPLSKELAAGLPPPPIAGHGDEDHFTFEELPMPEPELSRAPEPVVESVITEKIEASRIEGPAVERVPEMVGAESHSEHVKIRPVRRG